ncbi:vacuolar protein sorting-associated protein 37C [Anguilla anguilla]|uniref:vacuolar protein sorting-associated protein 37C n=1 Tax=Anguilla anguilla TaxID=7936 RepID=UPI0015A89D2B|nr:vacuolar protein sorting-associated protein 37C [Anguilla anguilla]XP_035274113.1 vacuolar protein sorting-associated protein 37C [Anguilla anguilla]XP_035274115.1 vacuolar protein sorting-associated protein 37C [Anguilla anguilla]XP_035274116.1 vacuolar protein sorting-associated protein 37C [Anguilla anguilla]XP_035274117.1 vacuolar protein sorting-associated protein 37C [Anguilla anguilla]
MSCGDKLMEKIQDLSQSELQDLLDDAGKVESLVQESDEVQTAQLDREMTLASNRSLAEQNLNLKPGLESQRDRLVEKYSELEAVRETYRQHCAQRDGIMGQVTPEGLLSRLQAAGGSTEAESEALAEQFLDGSLSLDSFLEHFLSLRSLAHRRRVRIEKLQDILRQKREGGADAPPGAMTSQTSAAHEAGAVPPASSPWQQQQQQHADQQQNSMADSKPDHGSFPNSSQSTTNHPLPYTPYPVSPPNPPPAVSASGPSNPQAPFQPYPSQSFTSAPSFPTPAPGFPAHAGFSPGACPYPIQPTFPGPARSQFRPYGSPSPPYPSPYPFPGYNYPPGPGVPPSQPPSGRPLYRPGFGLPQSYS